MLSSRSLEHAGASAVTRATTASLAAERFRAAARGLLSATGLSAEERAELERQMIDHLLDVYEAHVAQGVSPDVAIQRSLAAFGEPQPIRRQFLLRSLERDARAAVRLPPAWAALVVLDAAMAVVRPWAAGVASPIANLAAVVSVTRYLVFAIALLWIGHSAFRLSWRLCRRFMQGPDVEWELATGLGIFAMGFGLLLWTGPGFAFPAICDFIDRSLGRDSAMALTTLAVGVSVSLAAVLRDLNRTSDQLNAS